MRHLTKTKKFMPKIGTGDRKKMVVPEQVLDHTNRVVHLSFCFIVFVPVTFFTFL